MTLKQLIKEKKNSPYWKTLKVFICYSNDKISRLRSLGENVADGELFNIEDLDKDTLDMEIKPNQWWFEDGDLCIDTYRNW